MKICINGRNREVPSGTTLEGLVGLFKVNQKSVVLELNRRVVERDIFAKTELKEDDTVEIVQFVGGG
jgi:sulfur carrier protein